MFVLLHNTMLPLCVRFSVEHIKKKILKRTHEIGKRLEELERNENFEALVLSGRVISNITYL
jgi:Ran GTPase-activating protein (RanGAP) involved in mRNA processing and transport